MFPKSTSYNQKFSELKIKSQEHKVVSFNKNLRTPPIDFSSQGQNPILSTLKMIICRCWKIRANGIYPLYEYPWVFSVNTLGFTTPLLTGLNSKNVIFLHNINNYGTNSLHFTSFNLTIIPNSVDLLKIVEKAKYGLPILQGLNKALYILFKL